MHSFLSYATGSNLTHRLRSPEALVAVPLVHAAHSLDVAKEGRCLEQRQIVFVVDEGVGLQVVLTFSPFEF